MPKYFHVFTPDKYYRITLPKNRIRRITCFGETARNLLTKTMAQVSCTDETTAENIKTVLKLIEDSKFKLIVSNNNDERYLMYQRVDFE